MFYLLNYKSEMKENAILCRIKILKAIFVEKINNRKLSKKIKVHYNTIWNIKNIFNLTKEITIKIVIFLH
jgi:transposase